MLTPNSTLQHGRYRIIRPVAQGGMGAVYEAYDNNLNNRVALKEALLTEPQLRRAFEREAQRLDRLRHVALPTVKDHFTEGGKQYLVMDDRACIDGDDLGKILQQHGRPLPVSTIPPTSAQPTTLFTQTSSHTEPEVSQIGSVSNVSPKSGRDNKQMLLWASILSIVLLIGVFLVLYADKPAAGATTIAQTDGMVQVYVPEGDFEMGSDDDDPDASDDEKPRHTVYLDAFWIDQTEVTNAMFADFVAETAHQTDAEKEGSGWACLPDSEGGVNCGYVDGADWQHPQGPESNLDGLDNYPVIQVSWNDATAYCAWAERRLPTEAEWEKAAGGILTEEGSRKYPWGNDAPSGERVNFCDENCPFGHKDSSINDGYERTSPVGNYAASASPYGTFDMAGNVWEWIKDSYDSNYYASSPRQNPTGPSPSNTKVLRGGSWVVTAPYIRVRFRDGFAANDRGELFGFRCARSP